MKTYNRNESFALKLDATSGDRVITVWEPRHSTEDAVYLQEAEHVILNGFIKNLRVKAQINSISEVTLPNLTIEQSRVERLNLVRNLEWTSARKHLKLHVATSPGVWFDIATVSLLNVPPYRLINLMEYFTPGLALELGATGAIGVSMENAGYGLLSGNDELIIYGSATCEVIVIPRAVEPINSCQPYGWTVGTTSQVILGAQNGRKQITLVNKGNSPVYLGLGTPAEVNKGITLMNNGGSYEFNRSNNPFNLYVSAISEAETTLTGLVCV